jgi:hypothetical protein
VCCSLPMEHGADQACSVACSGMRKDPSIEGIQVQDTTRYGDVQGWVREHNAVMNLHNIHTTKGGL